MSKSYINYAEMLHEDSRFHIPSNLHPFTENADFTVPNPLQVTIPAGPIPSSPVCVPIMATEDTQIEGDHGFTVSINQPSLSTVTVGTPGSALVTITDNDGIIIASIYMQEDMHTAYICFAGTVMIQFENPVLSVQEGDGVVEVCVQIIIPVGATLGCDITVPFVANSGQHTSMSPCHNVLTVSYI